MEETIIIEAYSKEKESRAYTEFLYLIMASDIPKDSMFFSGTMTIHYPDKTHEEIPVQLVALPDKKYKFLDSANNIDLVRQEFSDKSIQISLKGKAKKLSFDEEGRILMDDLNIKASPDETGLIAELRVGEKKDGPIEPVLQVTTEGLVILDWQGYLESLEANPINITSKVGDDQYFLRDATKSDAFQTYLDRLAAGEFPEQTAFLFKLMPIPDGEEVKIQMTEANAELPDGTIIELQKGINEFLQQLISKGVQIEVAPRSMRITVRDVSKCPECGDIFTPKRKDQVYCSKKCGNRVRGREAYHKRKALHENKAT